LTFGSDPQSAAGVREGEILAGKYRVEKVLGVGGMGVVVAARHLQLDEKVALKFLLPGALEDGEAVARFVREARAAVRIKNEHVARVTDVGTLDNGAPYIVMEYLEGGDLAAWIKQRGALPVEQAVEFVLQACIAVADAHALGIVHRDLKPANLFCVMRSDGQLSVKVLDFGISKLTTAAGTGPAMAMTKTTAVMGSPLYMSPEQMQSAKTVDARTDIWALGVVLFELIAARPPFLANAVMELAIKIANEPPPPLRNFCSSVPAGLEDVVLKCLKKDPRQRYRHIGELAFALLPFAPKRAKSSVERIAGIIQAAGLSASASAMPAFAPSDETQVSAGTLPAVGRTTLGVTGRKSAFLGVGILGVLAIAAGAAFVVLTKKAPIARDEPQAAAMVPVASAVAPPSIASVELPKLAPEPAKTNDPVAAMPLASAAPSESAPPAARPPKWVSKQSASATMVAPPAPLAATAPPKTPPPAAAAPPAKPPPNCDPPYYFDARGNRAYKPECL
jgi:hypothetical protein